MIALCTSFIRGGKYNTFIHLSFALLKENPLCNYQVFLCLKSIACTVPILFNSNIQQVFDSILEPFNNLYLLFEKGMIVADDTILNILFSLKDKNDFYVFWKAEKR